MRYALFDTPSFSLPRFSIELPRSCPAAGFPCEHATDPSGFRLFDRCYPSAGATRCDRGPTAELSEPTFDLLTVVGFGFLLTVVGFGFDRP